MKKVMIADDAKLMRDIIQRVLLDIGEFEIIIAHNGDEAIDLYKREKPDITTMDITMEGRNGLEATQEIIRFDPNAKIIIITSLGQEKLLNSCMASGAQDYIIKPFTKDRIRSAVLNVLGDNIVASNNQKPMMMNPQIWT